MTIMEHQAQVDRLVARRHALRGEGASRHLLDANRLAIGSAIRAMNRALITAHLANGGSPATSRVA
jgi:hypothetical protein